MICESKTPMPRLLDSVTNNSICSNSVPANNIFFRIQNLMKVFFKFQLGFPMGRESLVSWDKGTEVSSLSRDKGTAMGQPRDSHRIRGTEGKKVKNYNSLETLVPTQKIYRLDATQFFSPTHLFKI